METGHVIGVAALLGLAPFYGFIFKAGWDAGKDWITSVDRDKPLLDTLILDMKLVLFVQQALLIAVASGIVWLELMVGHFALLWLTWVIGSGVAVLAGRNEEMMVVTMYVFRGPIASYSNVLVKARCGLCGKIEFRAELENEEEVRRVKKLLLEHGFELVDDKSNPVGDRLEFRSSTVDEEVVLELAGMESGFSVIVATVDGDRCRDIVSKLGVLLFREIMVREPYCFLLAEDSMFTV